MPRARVVVDSNVLISRLLAPRSVAGQAVSRLVTHAQVLVSDHTLAELADGLSRSKFDPYVSLDDRKEFFRRFARLAEIVTVTSTVRACRDAKDDKFLELAVDGAARFIVTGDKDLLTLSPFRAVVILNPAQALELPASALTDAVGDSG
jgi:putative PIN family toxin of toxin-antitoxin system